MDSVLCIAEAKDNVDEGIALNTTYDLLLWEMIPDNLQCFNMV